MGPCTLPDMLLGVEKVGGELWSQNEALGRCVRRAMARQMMPVKAGARAREVEEEYMDEEEARVVRKRELKERGEELRDLIEKMSGRVRVEALKGGNGGGKMEDGEVQKLAEFFAEKLAGDE